MNRASDDDCSASRQSQGSPSTTSASPEDAETVADDADEKVAAHWLALQIARLTLRLSRYPARRWIGATRRKLGRDRGGEGFVVPTDDGVTLDAWYSPAPGHRRGEDRLPVVMMHGWIEIKEFHFLRAWRLNRAGHDVILFDHRAHGRSTGKGTTFGVRERADLAAVIRHAQQQGRIDRRCITLGYSMGGAVALQHAPDDPDIAGVVALAPYIDFEQAVSSFRHKLAPWVDDKWLAQGFIRAARELGFGFAETSTLEAVRRLEAPVLLIEGGCDTNLPPALHTRKLAAAKERGCIECVTIDDATHLSLCHKSWPGLDQRIIDFCQSLA